MLENLRTGTLIYHRLPKPGKLEIQPIKPLGNQRDLALAYSPGVAAACEAIVDDPAQVGNLTARQNLVGVITNGTAVLGLGDIGPLASKPVMEGKAVLLKKFAGFDVFDIEVNEKKLKNLLMSSRLWNRLLAKSILRHQGPGMFRDRRTSERAHVDPCFSRRST